MDLKAVHVLRRLSGPGERLLVDSPASVARDIRLSSTLSGMTGLRVIGHSLPWPQEPVGTPPFHKRAAARAFWANPTRTLLKQLSPEWVYLREARETTGQTWRWLDQNGELVWSLQERAVFRVDPELSGGLFDSVDSSSTSGAEFVPLGIPAEVSTDAEFKFYANKGQSSGVFAWGFVPQGEEAGKVDLREVVSWEDGPCFGYAPPFHGNHDLVFFQVVDRKLVPLTYRRTLLVRERTSKVDQRSRLGG